VHKGAGKGVDSVESRAGGGARVRSGAFELSQIQCSAWDPHTQHTRTHTRTRGERGATSELSHLSAGALSISVSWSESVSYSSIVERAQLTYTRLAHGSGSAVT
jgi:hypothetical protein